MLEKVHGMQDWNLSDYIVFWINHFAQPITQDLVNQERFDTWRTNWRKGRHKLRKRKKQRRLARTDEQTS